VSWDLAHRKRTISCTRNGTLANQNKPQTWEVSMESNQTRVQQRQGVLATEGLGTALFEGAFFGFGLLSTVLAGTWTTSCLVGGIIAANGPAQLATSWFRAVSGM
jgi:hypothetical protein